MKPAQHSVATHLAFIVGIAMLLVLGMVYPFLPGGYDRLAVPLSTMAQVFGVVGLALVPGGWLWLTMPRFGFALSMLSTAVGTCVALILALFATLSVGNAFGLLTLAAWVYVLVPLIPRLKRLKRTERSGFHPAPVYLVCLPVVAFAAQRLETSLETGLDVFEVEHRRKRFGLSRLTPTQDRSLWMRVLLQSWNPLIDILLAAGMVGLAWTAS